MEGFELLFLGTCACDYSPRLKDAYKDRFDEDARRASSVLLDGQYMIDCGPHCLDSMRIAGVDPTVVTDLFLTHLHSDHFNPENVQKIALAKKEPLRLWVSAEAKLPAFENVTVLQMEKFTPMTVSESLTVVGLSANHDLGVFPQHLLFEKAGRKMLYALDGAWMLNATYNYLKKADLALFVVDATCGDYEGDLRAAEHNSIPMIRMLLKSLRTVRTVGEHTKIYLSHLAPSLHKSHRETAEIARGFGAEVAFDGLHIVV